VREVALAGWTSRMRCTGWGLLLGVQSAGLMVRPRRAEPVARPVRGVWVLGWWGGVWGGGCARCRGRTLWSRTAFSSRSLRF